MGIKIYRERPKEGEEKMKKRKTKEDLVKPEKRAQWVFRCQSDILICITNVISLVI